MSVPNLLRIYVKTQQLNFGKQLTSRWSCAQIWYNKNTPKKKYFSVRSCAVHFVRELNIIFQQKCILYEMTVLCPAKTYYRTVTLTIGGVPNLYSRAVHESWYGSTTVELNYVLKKRMICQWYVKYMLVVGLITLIIW